MGKDHYENAPIVLKFGNVREGGADKNLDTYRAQKGVNDVFRRTENKGTACFPSDRICYRCDTPTWLSTP